MCCDCNELQIFRTLAPEFSQVSDAQVQCWIELTRPLVSKKKFRALYTQALCLLTAHRLKLAGGYGAEDGDGSGGAYGNEIDAGLRVGSYSEGGISISYSTSGLSVAGMTDGELALTVYGLQYLELRRLVIIPIISAGEVL
jgi:hypothetical protein